MNSSTRREIIRDIISFNKFVPLPFYTILLVSKKDKKHTWILQSGSKIAYIVNEQIDHRFRITDKTKRVLEINHIKT